MVRDRKIVVTFSQVCAIKANSQITIAFGSFKEMKIDDRSAVVLGKYEKAGNDYAQLQGEYRYKIYSIIVLQQNFRMLLPFMYRHRCPTIREELYEVKVRPGSHSRREKHF